MNVIDVIALAFFIIAAIMALRIVGEYIKDRWGGVDHE